MIIQIYAFTRVDQAQQAAEMGVNQIGFVAGDYGLVPGELSFEEARELAAALPPDVHSVALTMATDVEEILRMVDLVEPNILHISTDPMDVGYQAMEQLRSRLAPDIKLMKAIPVQNDESILLASKFAPFSDYILLDSKVIGMPGVGATGVTHDWSLSRKIVETVPIPVILAGGLTPENVAKAIKIVAPAGVDSNTGTNLLGSSFEKDMQRIKDFIEAVQEIDKSSYETI
jgi:phosphoribosylanthranilate isomerase